jgi:hypothetical protein
VFQDPEKKNFKTERGVHRGVCRVVWGGLEHFRDDLGSF